MGKPYSKDLRECVVGAALDGAMFSETAERLGVSINSVVRFRRPIISCPRELGIIRAARLASVHFTHGTVDFAGRSCMSFSMFANLQQRQHRCMGTVPRPLERRVRTGMLPVRPADSPRRAKRGDAPAHTQPIEFIRDLVILSMNKGSREKKPKIGLNFYQCSHRHEEGRHEGLDRDIHARLNSCDVRIRDVWDSGQGRPRVRFLFYKMVSERLRDASGYGTLVCGFFEPLSTNSVGLQ
jgi:hypothetical protein